MLYRKLTSTGDYSFGNNDLDFVYDLEALTQAIKTRILLFYREWWEDLNNGIPMFQNIIGQVNKNNINIALQSLLTKRIQEFEEVDSVKYTKTEINDRTLEIEVICTLYSGEEIEISLSV